jgi:hypothetical protein
MKIGQLLDEETLHRLYGVRQKAATIHEPEIRQGKEPKYDREMEWLMRARAYRRQGRRVRQTRFC